MPPRFSLVYPTRHRPAFLAQALALLEQQTFQDFEVIVCDNFVDPALSCEEICKGSALPNLKYLRPAEPLGMVANWNFAAQFARGTYVCVFTDKMFLLPDALLRAARAINAFDNPDIVNWVSDSFQPARYPDYFGAGVYNAVQADGTSDCVALPFSPTDALNEKGNAAQSRYEQTPSQYCRGKMVFGAFHRSLIARITERFGGLFHDISPDYTSMILGLSLATTAVELKASAVVSIATDLSNGQLGAVRDQNALGYLQSLGDSTDGLFASMLVPGMYAAQHNVVAHDYLALRSRFGLDFSFNRQHWLGYCIEDLSLPDRVWSSPSVEEQQMNLVYQFLATLTVEEQTRVVERLENRAARTTASGLQPGQQHSWPTASLSQAIQRRSAWAA